VNHGFPGIIAIGHGAWELMGRNQYFALKYFPRVVSHESVHTALYNIGELMASSLLDELYVQGIDNYDDTGLPMIGLFVLALKDARARPAALSPILMDDANCWAVEAGHYGTVGT
jgi:hypothetical protein